MKKLIVLILIISSNLSFADDMVFLGSGDQLFPVYDSSIVIKKEKLIIRKDTETGDIHIDIYFEMYNTGKAKNVVLGFIPPPFTSTSGISEFKVNVNGDAKEYAETYFADTSEVIFEKTVEELKNRTFKFTFDANFRHGRNIIRHSYQYGYFTDYFEDYNNIRVNVIDYILNSINMWAGKEVQDFELIIDLGENVFFSTALNPDKYSQKNYWKIHGNGKSEIGSLDVTTEFANYNRKESIMFYLKDGYVSYRKKHFKPEGNLNITFLEDYTCSDILSFYKCHNPENLDAGFIYNGANFNLNLFCKLDSSMNSGTEEANKSNPENYSIGMLDFFKNVVLASVGFKFKTKELYNYFKKFVWYIPDKKLSKEELIKDEGVKDYINYIDSVIEYQGK